MNAVMNAVRKLLRDLVERRLWPVAVLLVIAAVAVPMYLGRSSGNGDANAVAPTATAKAGAKASRTVVTLDDAPADGATGGDVRNPFKQQHVPKAAEADTGAPTGSGAAGAPNAPAPSTGSGSGSPSPEAPAAPATPTPAPPATPAPDKHDTPDPDVSHVTLHLGKVGELTTFKDLARLSALPSADDPQFVFTGVLEDGKTAVLLPSSLIEISEESDVKCKPSNKSCQALELEPDDTVFFTLTGDPAGVQYQLDIVSVQRKRGSSAKAAATALQRHSEAGAATLRDAHVNASASFQGASAYRWLPDQGVLVRTPQASKAHASANGAAAASAADVAATLFGLPVWHWHAAA